MLRGEVAVLFGLIVVAAVVAGVAAVVAVAALCVFMRAGVVLFWFFVLRMCLWLLPDVVALFWFLLADVFLRMFGGVGVLLELLYCGCCYCLLRVAIVFVLAYSSCGCSSLACCGVARSGCCCWCPCRHSAFVAVVSSSGCCSLCGSRGCCCSFLVSCGRLCFLL